MLAHFSRPRAFGKKRTSAPATSIHSLHCTTFGKTRARCTKYRTQYAPARVIARCNRSATNANCACNSSRQGGDSHAARSQGERFLYRAKGCPKRQQSRFHRTGKENGPFVALHAHLQLCSCGHVYRGLAVAEAGYRSRSEMCEEARCPTLITLDVDRAAENGEARGSGCNLPPPHVDDRLSSEGKRSYPRTQPLTCERSQGNCPHRVKVCTP